MSFRKEAKLCPYLIINQAISSNAEIVCHIAVSRQTQYENACESRWYITATMYGQNLDQR